MRMGMRECAIPIAFEEADPAIHISRRDVEIAIAIKIRGHQGEELTSAPAALGVCLQGTPNLRSKGSVALAESDSDKPAQVRCHDIQDSIVIHIHRAHVAGMSAEIVKYRIG